MGWLRLLLRTVRASVHDDLLDWAAALAFYFLFAFFPTVLLIAALLGEFHLQGLVNNLIAAFARNLPAEASVMVSRQLHHVLADHVPGLISFGLVLLLYAASQGFAGLMSALNVAYEVPETRSYGHRLALAYGLAFSAGVLAALALALELLGQHLLTILAGPGHIGFVLGLIWPLIRWAATLLFMVLAIRLLYRFAPNARPSAAGAYPAVVAALVIWLIASALLAAYTDHFSNYSVVYGSLGAVIALMLWFYIFALALLFGAELHNEWLRDRGERREVGPAPKPRPKPRRAA